MIDIRVTIEGDKVIIAGLHGLSSELRPAISSGLSRIAEGAFDEAYRWLSGPGSLYETRTSKTGKTYRRKVGDFLPGQYPVPVRTGWLRRMLYWLKPGTTKTHGDITITTGTLEAIVGNAAAYAETISEGKGTSARHGRRPYIEDGLKRFNAGNKMQHTIEYEIGKTLKEKGLN